MSLINSAFTLILIVIIAAFAILNRDIVDVTYSPVHDPYALPLYAVILGALITGFLIGGCAVWINHLGLRRTKRKQNKQIKTLEKELRVSTQDTPSDIPPSDFFPALPKR